MKTVVGAGEKQRRQIAQRMSGAHHVPVRGFSCGTAEHAHAAGNEPIHARTIRADTKSFFSFEVRVERRLHCVGSGETPRFITLTRYASFRARIMLPSGRKSSVQCHGSKLMASISLRSFSPSGPF